ncbi:hypothetical protein BC940DRAFT_293270 [Gongronella butleri]|nr:hypothetical protein BC940DRAFT_293270 [Gongronella butleri]
MQSISGIVTQTHSTTGDIPPPLVGSSISVVDDRVFVFAGRLVTSRKMTNHLYVLDLKSLIWTRHIPPPDSDKAPKPRYFHSSNVHGRSLIVFGGMGYSRHSADGLCVLDDVAVFNIDTMTWKQPSIQPSLFAPRPRYAHLATISDGRLLVVGGQDMNNGYLTEINVLNLGALEWVKATNFEQHVGAYRSVAVATPSGTALPANLAREIGGTKESPLPDAPEKSHNRSSILYSDLDQPSPVDNPGPIFLYSNHNFANVNRELQIITESSVSPAEDISIGKRNNYLAVNDLSSLMTGTAMPPGLRFPTGDAIGQYIVIAGTYLSPQCQSYSIWALNTTSLGWTRVDIGNLFSQGSWNRGILYNQQNRYLVFGNMNRNLLEDYNHRQVNFDHVAMVDLEAFGIYQPPSASCAPLAQEMGLRLLSEPAIADFYIITRENQEIPVNSAVIRYRWPYFAKMLDEMHNRQQGKDDIVLEDIQEDNALDTETASSSGLYFKSSAQSMLFPYPYPVVVAFLQYLYTDNLLTAQQYQPHILSQLLLLGDMYSLPRLVALARHALHQMLNMSTAPLIFETAALSHQISLQIRALKLMIAAKKMIQQQNDAQIHRFSTQISGSEAVVSPGLRSDDDWENESLVSTTQDRSVVSGSAGSFSVGRATRAPHRQLSPGVDSRMNHTMPSRPSTALNYYGSARLSSNTNRPPTQRNPSAYAHGPDTLGQPSSSMTQGPSMIPDDDSFSMSSYSVYGTTASLTSTSTSEQKRRADKPRFFNALGNKFK